MFCDIGIKTRILDVEVADFSENLQKHWNSQSAFESGEVENKFTHEGVVETVFCDVVALVKGHANIDVDSAGHVGGVVLEKLDELVVVAREDLGRELDHKGQFA